MGKQSRTETHEAYGKVDPGDGGNVLHALAAARDHVHDILRPGAAALFPPVVATSPMEKTLGDAGSTICSVDFTRMNFEYRSTDDGESERSGALSGTAPMHAILRGRQFAEGLVMRGTYSNVGGHQTSVNELDVIRRPGDGEAAWRHLDALPENEVHPYSGCALCDDRMQLGVKAV